MVGCATLTLPRYEGRRQGEYSIDCDRGGTVLTQHIDRMVPWEDQWILALERLELLKKAAIVHTNRLHVALPCLAMGTPVVIHREDTRRIFQPGRLRLLNALEVPYDRPVTREVTPWVRRYLDFLNRNLGIDHSSRERDIALSPSTFGP